MAGQAAQVYGGYFHQDGRYLPVKQANFTVNATTATVVAAVTGKKIAVVAVDFTISAAGTVGWLSLATNIKDPQPFAANGGLANTYGPAMVFTKTASGEALRVVVTGGTATGTVNYVEEP